MSVIDRIRLIRRASVLVAGALAAAALLGPAGGTAATYYTRYSSCPGAAFQPWEHTTPYFIGGDGAGDLTYTGTSYATFFCDPGLPHGANVTKFQATMFDTSNTTGYAGCLLLRSDMAVSGNIDAAWQTMAEVLTTGPESPYYVRRTDSTIEYKTIDESRFAYMVMCELNSGGSAGAAGLLGVNITYRITAAKG